jgi:filamentous hemagglutinin family protein
MNSGPTIGSPIRTRAASVFLGAALAGASGAPLLAHADSTLPVPCVACVGGPSSFVSSGTAGYVSSGRVGTVTQQTERAILNWESFNVGSDATVNFVQPSTRSATLNRIFQADASRIAGKLTANGQVYLINSNGIVFGRGAQVNTGALIASALDIPDSIFETVGLAGAINLGDNAALSQPAFSGALGADVAIRIEDGATLRADERIFIFAPKIENRGSLRTNGGQALLAASTDKVYLASDTDLRGFLVEVDTGGSVENFGSIVAERGNVTLAGFAVNQSGRVQATTSVNVNGTIRLLARDRATPTAFTGTPTDRDPVATRSGTLTFGVGSVTEAVPESGSTATAVDLQAQQLPSVEAMARRIEVRERAELRARGGTLALTATSRPDLPLSGRDRGAQVHVAAGAILDVAGDRSTTVEMSRNQGTLRLFGNELADAPVQRDGPLARQEIVVDLRKGTPLTDISRLRDDVQRGVGERLAPGGTITIGAEGDVVLQSGSTADFSGGQVRYLDGVLETTKLRALDGTIVDISEASPERLYAGIVGRAQNITSRWGAVPQYRPGTSGALEPGYVEGKDAGRLTITAGGRVALEGAVRGDIVTGRLQRDPASGSLGGLARPFTQVPLRGLLAVSSSAPRVVFAELPGNTATPFGVPLAADAPVTVSLDTLRKGGVNRLQLTGAEIELPESVTLDLAPGGDISLTGTRVRLAGDVIMPSTRLAVRALRTPDAAGSVVVEDGATIDVSGSWVNDVARLNGGAAGTAPAFTNGGSVTLDVEGDLVLAAGSVIDVGAGARVRSSGALAAGKAGAISLASRAPLLADPSVLELGGELRGYGFDAGGSLSLSAVGFYVGDDPPAAVARGTVLLDTAFFEAGGFGSFTLNADRGGFVLEDGARIRVAPRVLLPRADYATRPTGADVDALTQLAIPTDDIARPTRFAVAVQRIAGVGEDGAALRVGTGATIETTAGGTIALAADTDVIIAGTLRAPAGTIAATLTNPVLANDRGFRASQAIRLTNTARLDARGRSIALVDERGVRSGRVDAGGSVTLDALRGYVVTGAGSVMDVSGTSEQLDLATGVRGELVRTTVASDAGSIEIRAAEGAMLFGEARGLRGGDGAAGGTYRLTLDASRRDPNNLAGTPLQFPEPQPTILVARQFSGAIGDASPVPGLFSGQALVSADRLWAGGFDAIDLEALPLTRFGTPVSAGRISFADDVRLEARRRITLDAGSIHSAGSLASVVAPYVAIGPAAALFVNRAAPQAGIGRLTVDADFVDLRGDTVFDGFAAGGASPAIALRSRGDIRLTGSLFAASTARALPGSLTAAGDVLLRAAQVHPSTLTDFTIRVVGDAGRIVVERGAADAKAPLSVAGRLALRAATIEQGGVLRAPFGTLDLEATRRLELRPGSITSVSGAGVVAPFGITEFGEDWVYPLGAITLVLDGAPEKRLELTAPEIVLAQGSVVDISGGGDLLSYEFVRGPGGSRDVLLADNPEGSFAIVPSSSLYGVYDPYESTGVGFDPGRTIVLGAGSGLKAGEYAVLPARYALLPGAYLVRPVSGYDGIRPESGRTLADGKTPVVAGRLGYANTQSRDAQWQGFAILDGGEVRRRSEFRESLASKFFTQQRPADAGDIVIDARRAITLNGALAAASAGGRAAQVDFVADSLAVVAARTSDATRVELVASELQNFAAASLLLGGTRGGAGDAVTIATGSRSVVVESGVTLRGPELLLAARDEVAVRSGARLEGVGAIAVTPEGGYELSGDGAFVRVSTGELAVVERRRGTGASGNVRIDSGATLAAGGSVAIESSRDFAVLGDFDVDGGLGLSAVRVSLGDAPATTTGLVLTSDRLARLDVKQLALSSRSTIDLYGALDLEYESLALDAAKIRGFAVDGVSRVAIAAGEISLGNAAARAPSDVAVTGSGSLQLSGGRVAFTGGALEVSGFGTTRLAATGDVRALESADVRVRGDLEIAAVRIRAASGADFDLGATGALRVSRVVPTAPLQPGDSLGARVALSGDQIVFGGEIAAASGAIELRAAGAGGLTLTEDARLDVGGVDIDFRETVVGTPGGRVLLAAASGDVFVRDGARIDTAGGPRGGTGGRLEIDAEAGTVTLSPAAELASGGEAGGEFRLVAARLGGALGTLNAALNDAGYTQRRSIAIANGDFAIGASDRIVAREFDLAVGGVLDVAGEIDASGPAGGSVRLSAGRDLRILGSARIDARGSVGSGGRVELATREGAILLAATDAPGAASIAVGGRANGGAPADEGAVLLRAPRVGAGGVAVQSLAGTITGANSIDVEAFRSYALDRVDFGALTALRGDTDAYMAAAASSGAPGGTADPRVRVLPGIEIASAGDLVLATDWDLADWRYGGAAGVLTLRAAGNLRVERAMSDGVRFEAVDPSLPGRDVVQAGESWSYRLVAGAGGADPLGTRSGIGTLTVGPGAYVRTGTGRIDLAAGQDVVLASGTSAVYTVGRNRGTGALRPIDVEILLRGDFVDGGGDVTVRAGRDVRGVMDRPLADWQPRLAGEFAFYEPGVVFPAAWAIDASKFQQGFGVLGGGHVTVRAGRDLDSLLIAAATNGRPDAPGAIATAVGGGTLVADAGRDVLGGAYHGGAGSAAVRAGGRIAASTIGARLAPVLAVGDARFTLSARTGATLETAFNPTVAEQDPTQGLTDVFFFPTPAYFFTYGSRSALDVSTIAGNVALQARGDRIAGLYFDRLVDPGVLSVLPGSLRARSLAGDVLVNSAIDLYPAANGALELLAGRNVTATGSGAVNLPDADPLLLPSVATPSGVVNAGTIRAALGIRPARPLRAADTAPALVVARDGFVGATGLNALRLNVAKQIRVSAGTDVANLTMVVQHSRADETTVVDAGRDVVYTTARRTDGGLSTNSNFIDVAGPGRVDVLAGRNVDFGASVGLQTRGNLTNPALPDGGADVSIWTGGAQRPDFDAFIKRYLEDSTTYSKALAAFLDRFPRPDGASDVAAFRALPETRQRAFLADVLFEELRLGGINDFDRGFDAIATLFPTDEADEERYAGDLRSFLSRIATIDGGNIDLIVPNGLVNAGVAASGRFSKRPSELGIVAQRDGSIRGFVSGDFLVNASRVFALDGGDIVIWSSKGDIDAGRGARSALAIPPPTTTFDAQGNVVIDFPAAISGSGIRAAVTTLGRKPGDVFLFAPAGVVDAGDAGIASAGNVTINATQVLGADNIQVGGVAVGVPVEGGGLGVGLSAASASSSAAASEASGVAQGDGKSTDAPLADSAVAWLEVFVVGLGDENCKPDDLECLKRQKRQ